ncbi:conserved Plasmodium protein, unknown function [Plasmodium ovale curtisi]|nr:conserved Plasmodium protein, unknown function [Plasmodium ovale curtisi]
MPGSLKYVDVTTLLLVLAIFISSNKRYVESYTFTKYGKVAFKPRTEKKAKRKKLRDLEKFSFSLKSEEEFDDHKYFTDDE